MNETIVAVRKEKKLMPGLMTCDLDLHIAKATAVYQWTGPKMNQEMWWQICSFFEWTYEAAKSESQVRLFVNSVTKEWAAWAFPQKRGTGMTTTELSDDPRWDDQRRRFPDPDWYYYGTVHHHCSCGAFQSGTDEQNEKDQDGLHITVGKIGSTRYDIDCRLYQSRWRLSNSLNMADFWDIGERVKELIPADLHQTVALHQMCQPPPKGYAFPVAWQENYIVPPPPVTPAHVAKNHQHTPHWASATDRILFCNDRQRLPSDVHYDCRQAALQMLSWLKEGDNISGCDREECHRVLVELGNDKMIIELCRLMWLHDVSPVAFEVALGEAIMDEELAETLKENNKLPEKNGETEKDELDKLTGEGALPDDEYGHHFMS
jgi:hypothetical protein